MIGTLINCFAIILGSAFGLLLRRGMKESISKTVMQGVGLSVILIGVMGAIQTQNTLLVILSMVIGGVLGAWVNIDAKMNQLGDWAQKKLTRDDSENNTFAQGFVTASLVYCVGAMAVVGALDSGIRGDHSTLIAKAILDGVTAIVFTSSLGIGVMLSAVPILIYQGHYRNERRRRSAHHGHRHQYGAGKRHQSRQSAACHSHSFPLLPHCTAFLR